MTETLKTLMDRAADRDFAAADLATITSRGDRMVRGRRRRWAAAGVTALTLAVGATAVVAGGEDDSAVTQRPDSAHTGVTWVIDQSLRTPTASYDLGHFVSAYVRTTVGFATLTREGEVYSYLDGQVLLIGEGAVGEPSLVADTEGSWVGWIDRSAATPAFVVHDLATGRSVRRDVRAGSPGEEDLDLFRFIGIDDQTAYWANRGRMFAADVETMEPRELGGLGNPVWISNVEDGMLVRLVETDPGADLGSEVVDLDGTAVLPYRKGRFVGIISPDGRWVTGGGEDIVELGTGERLRLDTGMSDGGVYEWLDADTVAVLGEDGDDLALLTCEIPSGTCTVADDDITSPGEEMTLPGSPGLLG